MMLSFFKKTWRGKTYYFTDVGNYGVCTGNKIFFDKSVWPREMEDYFNRCVYDNDFIRGFHSSLEEIGGKSNSSKCFSGKFCLETCLQKK